MKNILRNPDNKKKRGFYEVWVKAHIEDNNICKLFERTSPNIEISKSFIEFINSRKTGINHIYIMMKKNERGNLIPLYIGKSNSPRTRWLHGHLRNLLAVEKGEVNSKNYNNWLKKLNSKNCTVYLMCVDQEKIKFPPIPGFSVSVGSIEYQLISLATDAFDSSLLNSEGVAR